MKIRQVPHYVKPDELMIVVETEDENESCLDRLEKFFYENFSAIKTEELVMGIDQIYIDFKIEDRLVTLAWDSMAGISIHCALPELREKIFKHLQRISHQNLSPIISNL
ncbi:hypothetical protein PN499_28295 [Kamptonema animale CS-326]|jgi:hypothetical protein|uniref:hypothetical protein n=1 Tax=Kamptonema animale TaxID=92934 RepID=UPI00232CA298|nr:hypothetical protein [Kamptonema animale]MDB9515106.1 hypothetical protein [Kamptonema animale CS-326]